MVPADRNYTWTPNGVYEFGKSNYEVLYCCDAVTGYVHGVHYKRMNLEDSGYYSAEEAAHEAHNDGRDGDADLQVGRTGNAVDKQKG